MKKYSAIALLLCLLWAPVAQAEETKSLNIAVVDVQQLMNNSRAAKSIQDQGKDLRKKYQKRIEKLEDKLKASEKKVVDASKEKDKEKFIESRKDFQTDLVESQKELRELNQKLDTAIATALNKLKDEIVDIIDNMTAKNGYDLVLTRADVVTVSKDIDITSKVMDRLNDEVKSIKVKD